MARRGVRRPSVCKLLSKSLLLARRQMAGSPPNLYTMDSRSACIQDVLKVKVKVKGHVIRALFGFLEWATPSLTVKFRGRAARKFLRGRGGTRGGRRGGTGLLNTVCVAVFHHTDYGTLGVTMWVLQQLTSSLLTGGVNVGSELCGYDLVVNSPTSSMYSDSTDEFMLAEDIDEQASEHVRYSHCINQRLYTVTQS